MKTPAVLLALLAIFTPAQAQCITGEATYYHDKYVGRPMANGQPFSQTALTMACWDYPLGTVVRVTYGRRSVVCVVTDRGPARRTGHRFDLSREAFRRLENPKKGVIKVTVTPL